MKKLLAILLLAATVMLCLAGCAETKNKTETNNGDADAVIDIADLYKKFTDAYLLEYTYGEYEYDDNGAIVKHTGEGFRTEFEYDVDNNIVNANCYNDGQLYEKIEYNENAKQLKSVIYTREGAEYQIWEYKYDDDEKLLEVTKTDPYDSHYMGCDKYEYDEKGNLLKSATYNENGKITDWAEFDSDGNFTYNATITESHNYKGEITWIEEIFDVTLSRVAKRTVYDDVGNVLDWTEYTYNENGNLVKETSYEAEGEITSWTEYDESGNPENFPVKTYIFDDMRTEIIGWEEFEYDDNNNQIKLTRYEADGSIELYVETEYEDGICIKKTRYDSNGKIHLWAIPEYDENGNISFYTVYSSGDKELYVGEIDECLKPISDSF